MKSGIYIHIGLHKTGTTTLQRFFAHNEKVFNKHGYFFPHACRENKADQIIHSNLSWELMNHGMFDPALGTFQELLGEISRGTKQQRWILTGEGLSRLPKPAKLLKPFQDHPLTLIVYVRDPVEAAPSLYSEQLKAGCIDTFHPWIVRKSARWLNHDQILEPWRRAVAAQETDDPSDAPPWWLGWLKPRKAPMRLIERTLQPDKLHKGSLVEDFLSLLEPRRDLAGLTQPPTEHHNPRISTLECLALLFVNSLQRHAPPSCDKEAIQQRNEARQIVRKAFPDCVGPFESTARQRVLLKELFVDRRDPATVVRPSVSGNTNPPRLLNEILEALTPIVPAGLTAKPMNEARERVIRFIDEQDGVDSLRPPIP